MTERQSWTTGDPLGIGGLLFDACRAMQLAAAGLESPGLAGALVRDAETSLASFTHAAGLREPAEHRLAFRELGLSIGLRAVAPMQTLTIEHAGVFGRQIEQSLEVLREYVSVGTTIELFWRDPRNRSTMTWRDHQDINEVMLATSLLPDEFLAL